jgi:acyl-CoA thioester hydrolase
VWADEAVNAWWIDRGVRWEELGARGLEYFVVASSLSWRSSARWGETVAVDAELDTLGRTSLAVRFVVRVGERVCCEIRTTYVCTADGAATPWPDDVRSLVSGGESARAVRPLGRAGRPSPPSPAR